MRNITGKEKNITKGVKRFWGDDPCGTYAGKTQNDRKRYFEEIELHRYKQQPFIKPFADFQSWKDKDILEIGIGAGTDFLQFCRSGAHSYGVDLTHESIEILKERLDLEGLTAHIQTINAESLPFEENKFDFVYSFGVIHHSNEPEKIINEIYRVLKSDSEARIMLYNRYSWLSLLYYLKFGVMKLRPWRSLDSIMWNYRESIGTKVYSRKQVRNLCRKFSEISINTVLTSGDYVKEEMFYNRMKKKGTVPKILLALYPSWLVRLAGNRFGFYHLITLRK